MLSHSQENGSIHGSVAICIRVEKSNAERRVGTVPFPERRDASGGTVEG